MTGLAATMITATPATTSAAAITLLLGSLQIGDLTTKYPGSNNDHNNKNNSVSNVVQPVKDWKKRVTTSLSKTLSFVSPPPPPPPPAKKNILIKIYDGWFKLPQIFRFFVSGNLGNLCFFYLEQIIYDFLSNNPDKLTRFGFGGVEFLDKNQAGISFFAAYLLQIVSTHLLFAVLVYGITTINTPEKYFKTLSGQFKIYAVSLVGSTILNTYLLSSGIDKTAAFFATMLIFACFNYFLVSWAVDRALESAGEGGKNDLHQQQQQQQQSLKSSKPSPQKTKHMPSQTVPTNGASGWVTKRIHRGGAFWGGRIK
jgi:hypothetical protein